MRLMTLQSGHRDHPLFEVRRRHHGPALILPGDPGTQVRHARQVQGSDDLARVQVEDLALPAAPRRSHQVAVVRIEEEIVQSILDRDAAQGKILALMGDLPNLRHVLECHHEAVARRRLVDGAHPRGRSVQRSRRDDSDEGQIRRIEQDDGRGQVVAHEHVTPIGGDGQVAGVDRGPGLGHCLEVVEVVLADPAIPGGQKHVPAIGRILRAAVQPETGGRAVQGLEPITVQDREVMVTRFDDHEQVHGIGLRIRITDRPSNGT